MPRLHRPSAFEALVQDLVWPMLLRAPRFSVRPARIGLGAAGVLLVALLWQLPGLWRTFPRAGSVFESIAEAAPSPLLRALSLSGASLSVWGWLALVASAIIFSIVGGSIARSVATEFALRQRLPWPQALRFGLLRATSFAALVLLPAAAFALAWGFIALFGWAMLTLPVLQVLGGALYFVPLLVGVAAAALMVALAFGLPMLAPSLACEGIDAIDSLQRTLAYVVSRPFTLLLQLALVGVLGVVLVGLASNVATLAVDATFATTTATKPAAVALADAPTPTWSQSSARSLVRTWSHLPGLLVAGLGVSYFFSGGTLLYLSMRHACDGQDPEELWTNLPGETSA
jgi:hypothetical protein